MRDSAAGATMAAPAPWRTRAASSSAGSLASPPARLASANATRPMMNMRRRPNRSAARPPRISSPPKEIAYPVTTHCTASRRHAQFALDRGQRHVHDAEIQDHHERGDENESQLDGAVGRGFLGRGFLGRGFLRAGAFWAGAFWGRAFWAGAAGASGVAVGGGASDGIGYAGFGRALVPRHDSNQIRYGSFRIPRGKNGAMSGDIPAGELGPDAVLPAGQRGRPRSPEVGPCDPGRHAGSAGRARSGRDVHGGGRGPGRRWQGDDLPALVVQGALALDAFMSRRSASSSRCRTPGRCAVTCSPRCGPGSGP